MPYSSVMISLLVIAQSAKKENILKQSFTAINNPKQLLFVTKFGWSLEPKGTIRIGPGCSDFWTTRNLGSFQVIPVYFGETWYVRYEY